MEGGSAPQRVSAWMDERVGEAGVLGWEARPRTLLITFLQCLRPPCRQQSWALSLGVHSGPPGCSLPSPWARPGVALTNLLIGNVGTKLL